MQALTWVNAYRVLIMLLAVWSVWLYTNLLTDSLFGYGGTHHQGRTPSAGCCSRSSMS
jgi:hypothetical protein